MSQLFHSPALFYFLWGGGCGSHHSHPGKKSTALSYINLSVYHQNYEYYSKSLQTPQITTCRITRVQSVPYLQSQQRRRTPHPGVERARSTYQTQQHQSSDQHTIPCARAMRGGLRELFHSLCDEAECRQRRITNHY